MLFIDYIGQEVKKPFAESVINARYFVCLSDGNANNNSVMEQEIMYCVPVIKYVSNVSIQFAENANAEGVKKNIEDAFQGLRVTSLVEIVHFFTIQ